MDLNRTDTPSNIVGIACFTLLGLALARIGYQIAPEVFVFVGHILTKLVNLV